MWTLPYVLLSSYFFLYLVIGYFAEMLKFKFVSSISAVTDPFEPTPKARERKKEKLKGIIRYWKGIDQAFEKEDMNKYDNIEALSMKLMHMSRDDLILHKRKNIFLS